MTTESAGYEEDYEEYDEFDEDDDEDRGLSGLVVLLMGVVMLGAFASVVWIAYQQGIKNSGSGADAPYVTADPEPLKIENQAAADAADNLDREVYDRFNGEESNPVEVIAEGPEEPVARESDDPIGAIASEAAQAAEVTEDAVADRIASLAAADEALAEEDNAAPEAADVPTPTPAPAAAETSRNTSAGTAVAAEPPTVSVSGDAMSGTHLVQIGAFRSDEEARQTWSRVQDKLGDYAAGKSIDIERADLGDRGVYHRLRIGPFASSDAAKTYCEGLKSRGQDCLVKAK